MKPSTHLFASMAAAALFASSARAAKIPDGMQWGVVLSFGNNQNNFQKTTLSYGRTLNIPTLRIVRVYGSANGHGRVGPCAIDKLFFSCSGRFHYNGG